MRKRADIHRQEKSWTDVDNKNRFERHGNSNRQVLMRTDVK